MLGARPLVCSLGSGWTGGSGAWGSSPVWAAGAREFGYWT